MQLIHYSDNPLESVYSVAQDSRLSSYAKPKGLWVTVPGDDDWPSWCLDNAFCLDCLRLAHEITLTPDARILHLDGVADIDRFMGNFGTSEKTGGFSYDFAIDWPRVAERYQGILIVPYCWERRLECMWYYGWDCSSGCIWDGAAVASITSIQREEKVA